MKKSPLEVWLDEARAEERINTLTDLVKKGLLSVKIAAEQANMTEKEFNKKMKATLV